MFDVKGAEAQWKTIFGYISSMEIGDEVKYDQLYALLPDAPEGSVKGAIYRAIRQAEEDLSRTLACIRGVGFRMVEAREHEALARGQHLRAKRRLRAARSKLHSADRSRLTPDERRRFDALEDHLARQASMIRRLDERQTRTEQEIKTLRRNTKADLALVSEQAAQAARSAVEELLARHGITGETKV